MIFSDASKKKSDTAIKSQPRYATTQDEIAGILGMSRQQFGKYASRDDAPAKTKSGYNVKQWTEYVKSVKSGGLTGDGSLKDEKLLREIKRLDIMIDKDLSELVNRKEAESEYKRELINIRKVIDDWESHETAKYPEHVDRITELSARLIDMIRYRVGR